MRLRDEIRMAVAVILSLQIFTLLGAVGLLSRMAPAVEQILSENEYSMHAAEEMLVALLRDDLPLEEREQRFEKALRHAESNVTEPDEPVVLDMLDRTRAAALAGDVDARRTTVEALTTLTAINRGSMRAADERARELGWAGAWAAVLLGFLSFAGSLALIRRLDRNVTEPLLEIRSALRAIQTGDALRRCRVSCDTHEIRAIAENVDGLLAEHFSRARQGWQEAAATDRALVLGLLDRLGDPAWVLASDGTIRVANAKGLDRLAGDETLALRLRGLAARSPDGDDLDCEALGPDGWLVREVIPSTR